MSLEWYNAQIMACIQTMQFSHWVVLEKLFDLSTSQFMQLQNRYDTHLVADSKLNHLTFKEYWTAMMYQVLSWCLESKSEEGEMDKNPCTELGKRQETISVINMCMA